MPKIILISFLFCAAHISSSAIAQDDASQIPELSSALFDQIVKFHQAWQPENTYHPYGKKFKLFVNDIATTSVSDIKNIYGPEKMLGLTLILEKIYQEGVQQEASTYLKEFKEDLDLFNSKNAEGKMRHMYDGYGKKVIQMENDLMKNMYTYERSYLDKKKNEYLDYKTRVEERFLLLKGYLQMPSWITIIRNGVKQDYFSAGNLEQEASANQLVTGALNYLLSELELFDPSMLEEEKYKLKGQLDYLVSMKMLDKPLPTVEKKTRRGSRESERERKRMNESLDVKLEETS